MQAIHRFTMDNQFRIGGSAAQRTPAERLRSTNPDQEHSDADERHKRSEHTPLGGPGPLASLGPDCPDDRHGGEAGDGKREPSD